MIKQRNKNTKYVLKKLKQYLMYCSYIAVLPRLLSQYESIFKFVISEVSRVEYTRIEAYLFILFLADLLVCLLD